MSKRKSPPAEGAEGTPRGASAPNSQGASSRGEVTDSFLRVLKALDACAEGDTNAVLSLVDAEATQAERVGHREFDEWARFLRTRSHLLARGRAGALTQLGLLEPPGSTVLRAAETSLARGHWQRPLIRKVSAARAQPTACMRTLEGHTQAVVASLVHPDGKRLITAGVDESVRVWDLERGVCLQELPGHSQGVSSLAIVPDGTRLVAAGGDGTVRIWDLESARCLFVRSGHVGRIEALVLHPDGARAVTAGRDRSIRVWNLHDGACTQTLYGHANVITSLAVHPDGRRLISTSDDRTIKVWDLDAPAQAREGSGRADAIVWVGFAREVRQAFSVSFNGRLRIWDTETGECTHTIETGMRQVRGAAVRPDGRRVVLLGRDRSITEWNVASSSFLGATDGGKLQDAQVAPDGQIALLYPGDGTIRAWDVATNRVAAIFEAERAVATLALPQGKILVLLNDRAMTIQDIATGSIVQWVHLSEPFDVSGRLQSDGLHLISLRDDCTVQYVNLDTGRLGATTAAHSAKVMDAGFCPDNVLLATASRDKSVRLWDLTTGAPVARWDGDVPLTCAAVNAENYLAVGDALGGVQIFRCVAPRTSIAPAAAANAATA